MTQTLWWSFLDAECVLQIISLYICICYSPESAEASKFEVQVGDIIVVATDGLYDNMSETMILRHTSELEVGTGA